MKKKNRLNQAEYILPEYNFTNGKRGKHFKEYRKGYSVKITQDDGSIITHYFSKQEGSIMLEPEVHE
jgi:hypothetical protein